VKLEVARRLGQRRRWLFGSLAAGGASQLALVVGGVLVARSLGATDRGYFALLLIVPHILSEVGNLGLPLAATYFIAKAPRHANRIARSLVLPASMQTLAGVGIQAVVLAFVVRHDPARVKVAAVISLAIIPGLQALQYGLAVLQGQHRFRPFNVLRVLPSAAYSAGVLAVFVLGYDSLIEITVVQVTAVVLAGALTLLIAARGSAVAAPSEEILWAAVGPEGGSFVEAATSADGCPSRKQMMRFGAKGLLGSMSAVETFRIDQSVIGLFLTPAALGLYVVGVSITNLPRFLAQSIGMIAYPVVATTRDRRASYRAVWRYVWISIAVSIAVVAPLELLAGTLIPFFFGRDFAHSATIARILLAGTVAVAARRVLTDGARGAGYPGAGTIAEIASWVALAPMLVLLVPRFGVNGVAGALAASWVISLAVLAAIVLRAGIRPSATQLLDPPGASEPQGIAS
jgi:O-antigen/teichoic acid export membrane protein